MQAARNFAFVLLVVAIVGCVSTQPSSATAKRLSPEERAVVEPLQGVLDGLAARDRNRIAAQLLPGGSATLMRNGKPVQMGFSVFADRLSTPGTDTREERIYEPLVHIDNNIAFIWTRYDFLLNGKLDHCGMDSASLVKVDDHWLIASLGDNSRTNCGK